MNSTGLHFGFYSLLNVTNVTNVENLSVELVNFEVNAESVLELTTVKTAHKSRHGPE